MRNLFINYMFVFVLVTENFETMEMLERNVETRNTFVDRELSTIIKITEFIKQFKWYCT